MRSRSRSSKNNAGAIGLVIFLVGIIGVFFARLIQAALSRQREYLADASAVQFTRNPDGIGGALKKIFANVNHNHVVADKAGQMAHMYFDIFHSRPQVQTLWLVAALIIAMHKNIEIIPSKGRLQYGD